MAKLEGFYTTCECGKDLIATDLKGSCPNCGRPFVIRFNGVKSLKQRFYDLFPIFEKNDPGER